MRTERYWVVDAFTDRPFGGNPAAVLLPAEALPDALMQAVAAENNLSETAFAVREGDAWRLRWFTPSVEVDLCGHATLATAFVLLQEGEAGPFAFETRSGRLMAARAGDAIELDFPAHGWREVAVPEGMTEALGVAPVRVLQSAGLVAVMPDVEAVRGLRPDFARIAALPGGVVAVTAEGGEDADVTSRYFAPGFGIAEDPVTGSMHAQVAPYWAAVLGRRELRCVQASARGGVVACVVEGGRVKMRGKARLYARGEIFLG